MHFVQSTRKHLGSPRCYHLLLRKMETGSSRMRRYTPRTRERSAQLEGRTPTTSDRRGQHKRGRPRSFLVCCCMLLSALDHARSISMFLVSAAATEFPAQSTVGGKGGPRSDRGPRKDLSSGTGNDTGGDNDDNLSVKHMVEWLGEVEVHVMVNVVLVGFHERRGGGGERGGEGGSVGMNFVSLDGRLLQEHLNELARSLSIDVRGGTPFTVIDQARENEVVPLGISQEILFHVSHAPLLSGKITSEVESAILDATTEHTDGDGAEQRKRKDSADALTPPVTGISRTAVDDAIRLHHVREALSYSLYLLHPDVDGRYNYIHGGHKNAEKPLDDANSEDGKHHTFATGCGYVGWVGNHERYAWLDLGANVSSGWGPRTRAAGVVSSSTFPDLAAAAAAQRGKGNVYGSLYADVAALAYRSASQLVVSPLLFTPARTWGRGFRPLPLPPSLAHWSDYETLKRNRWRREEVVVRTFFLCDASPCPSSEVQAWAALEQLVREPERGGGARWRGSGLMPHVTVEREEVVLWKSPLLATGLQQAIQPRRGGPFGPVGSISLATAELRHWLRSFLDERATSYPRGSSGVQIENAGASDEIRMIPNFVFILDTDTPVLLDHSVRSTAFPDMTISVSSRGDSAVVNSTFQCGGQNLVFGESEGIDNRNGRTKSAFLRDTFASLAQAIWGVVPRTLAWNPISNTFGTDYLWATGASLHSPLSSHVYLSFPERDAYLRTHIIRRLDAAVSAVRDVLRRAGAIEPRLAHGLNARLHSRATKHWHGIQDNLSKCVDELAVHHHDKAMRFVQALEVDVAGLGGVLSQGYGREAYGLACRYQPLDENFDVRTRDGGSDDDGQLMSLLGRLGAWMWYNVWVEAGLYVIAAICCAVMVFRFIFAGTSGGRRGYGRRKYKHS